MEMTRNKEQSMKDNVVIAVFEVESEAYQAFNQIKQNNEGKDYVVGEASLIKNNTNTVDLIDAFGIAPADSDTSAGIVIGSLVGLLGGPIGVILGASAGALFGNISDGDRAIDTASAITVLADKIYEGETAIVALVREEEPAFDVAFNGFKTIIARYDAADVADDVKRLQDLSAELSNRVMEEVKADREAERAKQREERQKEIDASFEEYAAETNKRLGDGDAALSPM